MLAYKAKNGPVPSYLKALVTPCTAPHSLRSASTARLVPPSLRDAASLPSAEDVPSQTFYFLLVFAGTRSASLLISGGDRRPHLPPSLPPLGGFRPSRAEIIARLYYALGNVAWLCCSAVDVTQLCCSAVDVTRPSCSAVDFARHF
ncbi:hypothetical protein QTP70_022345 [Hemibagrus guttatus]|uniref:Uncharacterized protein n=1 Tax=Hemibagrus guttatus TaxID=175788 RepID=A0AAE0VDA4_9TELE|nr:hypothetical protein QTP70_022345 [Hemibagrus guttatus]